MKYLNTYPCIKRASYIDSEAHRTIRSQQYNIWTQLFNIHWTKKTLSNDKWNWLP